MPTRKELLEELNSGMDQLSDAVRTATDDTRTHSDALAQHGTKQLQAAEVLADGLRDASDTLFVATIFGGLLGFVGKAVGHRIREIRMKTDLIQSIQSLQARHGALSYEFILERSFAEGATKEERQNLLNELIHDEIVTTKLSDTETFFIDSNNPKLIERQQWLDSIAKGQG